MAELTFTPANVVKGTNAQTERGTAGGTIAAGSCVYKDTAASNVLKACDSDALASAVICGVALNAATTGQPVEYQTSGYLTANGMTAGQPYFVSQTTAGSVCLLGDLLSDDYVSLVGIAVSATSLKLSINVTGIVVP